MRKPQVWIYELPSSTLNTLALLCIYPRTRSTIYGLLSPGYIRDACVDLGITKPSLYMGGKCIRAGGLCQEITDRHVNLLDWTR